MVNEYFYLAYVSCYSKEQNQALTNNTNVRKRKKPLITTFLRYEKPHISSLLKIAISGTPFEGSPLDLKGHLTYFAPRCWNNKTHYKHCSSVTRLSEITKMYQSIITSLGQSEEKREEKRDDFSKLVKEY
jgi:hypothetical protein